MLSLLGGDLEQSIMYKSILLTDNPTSYTCSSYRYLNTKNVIKMMYMLPMTQMKL